MDSLETAIIRADILKRGRAYKLPISGRESVIVFAGSTGEEVRHILNTILSVYLLARGGSIVAKAAETATGELVKSVINWAKRKLKAKEGVLRTIRIYGPDGSLVKELEIKEKKT